MGGWEGKQSKPRETNSGGIKQQPQACAVPEATGDQLSCPGCEQMEKHCPSLVGSEGEDIAIGCWESTGLEVAFAAPVRRFSKATSGDGGTAATGNITSLEFYLNLVTVKEKF